MNLQYAFLNLTDFEKYYTGDSTVEVEPIDVAFDAVVFYVRKKEATADQFCQWIFVPKNSLRMLLLFEL